MTLPTPSTSTMMRVREKDGEKMEEVVDKEEGELKKENKILLKRKYNAKSNKRGKYFSTWEERKRGAGEKRESIKPIKI